ncbi:unnamed protein product [Urochloa humidicola]
MRDLVLRLQVTKGSVPPNFTLKDQNSKPVVVYFYPADEMPGCTKQENLEIMHYFGSLKKQGEETNASSNKE